MNFKGRILTIALLCLAQSGMSQTVFPQSTVATPTCSTQFSPDPQIASITLDPSQITAQNFGELKFSRQSPAYFFNQYGKLELAAPNQMRFDYHPFLCAEEGLDTYSNPNCVRRMRGILIEEARTNLIPYSNDLSKNTWTKSAVTVIQPSQISGPDGLTSSANLVVLNGNEMGFIETTVSVVPNRYRPFQFSFFAKDISPPLAPTSTLPLPPAVKVQFHFSNSQEIVSTGLINIRGQYVVPEDLRKAVSTGSGEYFSDVEPMGGNWYRVRITLDPALVPESATSISLRLLMQKQINTSDRIALWGMQLESGPFPSSPITTLSSPSSRDNDRLRITPFNHKSKFSWYNDNEGNFSVSGDRLKAQSSFGYLMELNYEANDRQIAGVYYGSGYHLIHLGKEKKQIRYKSGDVLDGEPFKLSVGYLKASDGKAYLRSSLDGQKITRPDPIVSYSRLPKALQSINIGGRENQFNRQFNGHILSITYRNKILSLQNQIKASTLGCRTLDLSNLTLKSSMTEACDEAAVPQMDENGIWYLNSKWRIYQLCRDEGHILSYRCTDNVRIEGGYCKLITKQSPDTSDPSRIVWTTGSALSKDSTLYGYFEAAYKNQGLEGDVTPLNNAFWLWSKSFSTSAQDKEHCEIDVNEGHFPNKVLVSIFKHRPYGSGKSKKNYSKLWLHPLSGSDPDSLNNKDHLYSLSWNRQELIWYLDNQIIRKSPNYFCHRPGYVYLSSAILRRSKHQTTDQDPDTMDDIPKAMEGKNLEFKFIRTYTK